MVTPSIPLVFILSLQVFILQELEGLTLPLKTVTKCESFTKKTPNLKPECAITDNLGLETSTPDKLFSSPLPIDVNVKSGVIATNTAKNGAIVKAKEVHCVAPVIPKNASITAKTRPNVLQNSGTALGLNLPLIVSSKVTYLSNPNLKAATKESFNFCPKTAVVSNKNAILEDCVSASTVQPTPLILSNPASSLNSGLSNVNACRSNTYSPGFKSSVSASSACTNIKSIPANPSLPCNSENCNTNLRPTSNLLPACLELPSQLPISQNNIAKPDIPISPSPSPLNQISPTSETCNANVVTNNFPLTQSCFSPNGVTSSPLFQACPMNIGPNPQTYAANLGINNIPSCQSNLVPNKSPIAPLTPSNTACNNVPLSQSGPKNIVPLSQDGLSPTNIASNTSPLPKSDASNTGFSAAVLPQKDLSNICPNLSPLASLSPCNIGQSNLAFTRTSTTNSNFETPGNPSNSVILSSKSGINAIPAGYNSFNQAGNLPQNNLCNPSPAPQCISNSVINSQSQTPCTLNAAALLNTPSTNIETNSLASPSLCNHQVSTAFIPVSNSPMISTFIPSPNYPSSSLPFGSEIPNSAINKPQNIPCVTFSSKADIMQKLDVPCPKSVSCEQNDFPTAAVNANNFSPNYLTNQGQCTFDPRITASPFVPKLQEAIIFPTVQTFPPPANVISTANTILISDPLPVTSVDPATPNACPSAPTYKTSVSEYFKDVKAATSRLNDFISSFSNKFGIKSFPPMQCFSSLPSEILPQSTNTLQCSEEKCDYILPLPISKPTATIFQALQPSIPYQYPIPLNQECSSTCLSVKQDTTQINALPILPVQCCCNNSVTTPPFSATLPVYLPPSPSTSMPSQTLSSTVPYKAPIIPKNMVSYFNYPICPPSTNNIKDNVYSIPCNSSPLSLSNLLTEAPSKPISNLNTDSFYIPDVAPVTTNPSSFIRPSLSSILNNGKLTSPTLPKPLVSTYNDVTNTYIPDVLSAVLPKKSFSCETCRKVFPFLSSISLNTCPDCNSVADCSTASSFDDCSIDLSSQNSCLSPSCIDLLDLPTLDASQLDECCNKLENVIAMLELSLNLNGGVDCDLDSVPDILSTL